MSSQINVKAGWIQVTLYPKKRFDSPESFHEMVDPRELMSCWTTLKQIVDRVVDDEVRRSKSFLEHNDKTRTVVDIYNSLHSKIIEDENDLLKEVPKTGNFSEDEAKSLIKKVKQEKIQDGIAWY